MNTSCLLLLSALLLVTCKYARGQGSIFHKDTVEFEQVLSEAHFNESFRTGCHKKMPGDALHDYEWNCDTVRRKRLIYLNSKGLVFWHENPNDSFMGYARRAIENKKKPGPPDPMFRVSKKGKLVYYETTGLMRIPQFYLSQDDTLHITHTSLPSYLNIRVPDIDHKKRKAVNSGRPPFHYNHSDDVNIAVHYLKDTTIKIKEANIECYYILYRSTSFTSEFEWIGDVIIEKASCLPLVSHMSSYAVYPAGYKNAPQTHKEILMESLIFPKGLNK